MAYVMILAGLLFLLINRRQWKKLRRSSRQEAAPRRTFAPLNVLGALGHEWQYYALGDGSLRGCKGLIVALTVVALLLFVNGNWLGFDLVTLLPSLLLCAFIGQIRIGRALQRRYFENRFPEVLAVVNAAISAGNSVHQALHRCGDGIDGELGKVFYRIDRRLNLGEEPERVFRDAWQNYRYREFYFFTVVMLVSLQHGGQLKVLIGRLSRIIINSKNMSRRKAAMTSEARTSAKIVAAIPFLYICAMKYFNPENFDFLINDPTGRLVLYYAIASEALGMGIIWVLLKRAT